MHNNHVVDGYNMDAPNNEPMHVHQERYMAMTEGWTPMHEDPVVKIHDGVAVIREDLLTEGGTKTRGGDLIMSKAQADTFVYVQPRVGLAGVALLEAAAQHGKKIHLFMPASKQVSDHQAFCIANGATPHFRRIAAMPNLNKIALDFAIENGYQFVPLGLRHPLATAAIMRAAMTVEQPKKVYVATSTGVLTRALQIAWPDAEFVSVAVARNMKAGELGRADVVSEPLAFQQKEKILPPFPSVATYDAKVWKYCTPGSAMWNVGKEMVLSEEARHVQATTDSQREWGEVR